MTVNKLMFQRTKHKSPQKNNFLISLHYNCENNKKNHSLSRGKTLQVDVIKPENNFMATDESYILIIQVGMAL